MDQFWGDVGGRFGSAFVAFWDHSHTWCFENPHLCPCMCPHTEEPLWISETLLILTVLTILAPVDAWSWDPPHTYCFDDPHPCWCMVLRPSSYLLFWRSSPLLMHGPETLLILTVLMILTPVDAWSWDPPHTYCFDDPHPCWCMVLRPSSYLLFWRSSPLLMHGPETLLILTVLTILAHVDACVCPQRSCGRRWWPWWWGRTRWRSRTDRCSPCWSRRWKPPPCCVLTSPTSSSPTSTNRRLTSPKSTSCRGGCVCECMGVCASVCVFLFIGVCVVCMWVWLGECMWGYGCEGDRQTKGDRPTDKDRGWRENDWLTKWDTDKQKQIMTVV